MGAGQKLIFIPALGPYRGYFYFYVMAAVNRVTENEDLANTEENYPSSSDNELEAYGVPLDEYVTQVCERYERETRDGTEGIIYVADNTRLPCEICRLYFKPRHLAMPWEYEMLVDLLNECLQFCNDNDVNVHDHFLLPQVNLAVNNWVYKGPYGDVRCSVPTRTGLIVMTSPRARFCKGCATLLDMRISRFWDVHYVPDVKQPEDGY